MQNIFTVDLEDWYQAISTIDPSTWGRYEDRILNSTEKLLEIFCENNVNATFFILGYLAERYPALVRKIQRQGHEIACHGYAHKMVYKQNYEEFKQDLAYSKDILEQIICRKVIGFRAPWFSITKDSLWALDILKELNFEYDSSIFPIKTRYYGIPNNKSCVYKMETSNGQGIREITISKIRFLKLELPVAGGFYFRISPYWLTKKAIDRLNKTGKPIVMYLHPWELDVKQPRLNLEIDQHIIHYTKLNSTEYKLKRLLRDFEFTSIKTMLKNDKFGSDNEAII